MKLRNGVRTVVAVVCAVAVGMTAACVASPATEPDPLFPRLARIGEVFRSHAAQIWSTEYRPDLVPMLIGHRPDTSRAPEYAYVIGHPNPTGLGNAERVDPAMTAGLPPVYKITRGQAIVDLSRVPFFHERELAGAKTIMFNTTDGDELWDPRAEWFLRVIIHEDFHGHQDWTPVAPEQPDPTELPRDADRTHALALVEEAILDSAEPGTARETLRSFLAVRAVRYELEPRVRVLDEWREQFEGTARFMEDAFEGFLGNPPRDDQAPDEPKELFFHLGGGRTYEMGADLGRLLEELVGSRWRAAVMAGAGPAEVAGREVGVPQAEERAKLVAEAERRHDYPALLAKIQRADFPGLPRGEKLLIRP